MIISYFPFRIWVYFVEVYQNLGVLLILSLPFPDIATDRSVILHLEHATTWHTIHKVRNVAS